MPPKQSSTSGEVTQVCRDHSSIQVSQVTVGVDQLHRPIADWPLLLVGPIVRRVTPTSVAVFIATKEPVVVTLSIYDRVDAGRQPYPQIGQRPTVYLGTSLHVCVVEATGLALEPGHIYGYDIQLDTGLAVTDLTDLCNADIPLGYVAGQLPGFVLPGPLDTLRVIHCSCRKAHGCSHNDTTDPDALPMVDRLIQDSHTDPWLRPQQLFLTGDQIYSDDVPAAMLAATSALGPTLLGWSEVLALADGSVVSINDPAVAPGERSIFLDENGVKDRPPGARGWDEYAANHLLFFSEWCAMYLMAWSPELWQQIDNVSAGFRTSQPDSFFYYLANDTEVWSASPPTTLPTLIYAQGMAFVRRALANISTYMVFDDHDVTDDWFLNAKVNDQMRGVGAKPGPLGRRLMRNALTAYALFQHWGNDPDAFGDDTPGGSLLKLFTASSGFPPIHSDPTAADIILDIGPASVGLERRSERMQWDYELVFEQHRVIALDSRTWRGYPSGPRPITEQEALDAVPPPPDVQIDWGPDALEELAVSWSDASSATPPIIENFLDDGVACLFALASLGRIADTRTGAFVDASTDVRDAFARLLETLGSAPARAEHGWALDAIARAGDAIGADRYAPVGDLVVVVERAATALHEADFILRGALNEHLRDPATDLGDDDELGYLGAYESLADLLRSSAGFLDGSLYTRSAAARRADEVSRHWVMLAFDNAVALWGADAESADATLSSVAAETSEIRAALAADSLVLTTSVAAMTSLLDDPDRRLNAELISSAALGFQVHERVWNAENSRELTLVLSPAPVYGHALAERAQRANIAVSGVPEPAEELENEPWSGNVPGWHRLLDAFAPIASAVFLSGDVHYAFSSATDYDASDASTARFVQLTASATKNSWEQPKWLETLDEVLGTSSDVLRTPLDFIDVLPPQSLWDSFGPEARLLVPSREQVRASLQERREVMSRTASPSGVGDWAAGLLDRIGIGNAIDTGDPNGWEAIQQGWTDQTADELGTAVDLADDPLKAFTGDRLHWSTDTPSAAASLESEIGLDPGRLPHHRTVVLRDRRFVERIDDSPGLSSRLTPYDPRVLSGRTTVGHNNVGVVSTQTDQRGRFVTHELYWFPINTFDHTIQPDTPAAAFRDDWIITRHSAGLTVGMPLDGGLAGAPAPSPPITVDDVWFRIEVTSPGHTQQGQTRVHSIAAATPSMPQLTVRASLVGLSPSENATQSRAVRLECRYAEGSRADVVHAPGPTGTDWAFLPAGTSLWMPSFPNFCGGNLEVFARTELGGRVIEASTAVGAHAILGRNPEKVDVRSHASAEPNMEVVLFRESAFTQFADSSSQLGPFVDSPAPVLRRGDSFGTGQLDDPSPTISELWNWRDNVATSIARLERFRLDALEYQRQIQTGQPWNAATGTLDPPPPDQGIAHPEATPFTTDQLDLEMWSRYNGGRRFHDWDGQTWVRQPSTNTAVTVYAPALLELRRRVEAGDLPAGW
jgi:hypothetical protein